MRLRLAMKRPMTEASEFQAAASLVGGRLSYLTQVSRAVDMLGMAQRLVQDEKAWLLSHIGLIPDCDDGALEDQKWSSCSWLLLREFVRLRREAEKQREEAVASGLLEDDDIPGLPLPTIPYHVCRQIMTRPDYLERLDQSNIIAINVYHDVLPESELLLNAACEIVEQEEFDDLLAQVRERITAAAASKVGKQ